MNHSYTRASDAVSADAISTRAFLQQAVDHYPRLAVFSLTLKLPYREAMSEYRSLILHFHTEVWQRTGEYSGQRQQARRHSPPTTLRWMWESVSAPECKMVLLMYLDTLGAWRDEVVQQEMSVILREAWRTVTGTDRNGVTSITPMVFNCSGCGNFATPLSQLKIQVQTMQAPIATARTGMTG